MRYKIKDELGNEIGQRQINSINPAVVVAGAQLVGSYMQGQQNRSAVAGANRINKEIAAADRAEGGRQFDTSAGINQAQFGAQLGLGEHRYGYDQLAQNERGADARTYMENALNPYTSAGNAAQQQQMAMMGLAPTMNAAGEITGYGQATPEQMASTQSMFNESPGQRFLRERQETTLLRNQSALGGLGGGGAKRELAELGFNLAQTDMNNMYDRLGGIANRGFAGSQQLAGNALGTAQTSTIYGNAPEGATNADQYYGTYNYTPYAFNKYSVPEPANETTDFGPPPAPNVDPFWDSQIGGGPGQGGGGFGEGMGGGYGPSSSGMGGDW